MNASKAAQVAAKIKKEAKDAAAPVASTPATKKRRSRTPPGTFAFRMYVPTKYNFVLKRAALDAAEAGQLTIGVREDDRFAYLRRVIEECLEDLQHEAK